jgi:hypothetical protein
MERVEFIISCSILIIAAFSAAHAQSSEDIDRATREVDRSFRKEAEEKLSPQPEDPMVIIEEQEEIKEPPEAPSFIEGIRENLRRFYDKVYKKLST